jgi:hypothetical protein
VVFAVAQDIEGSWWDMFPGQVISDREASERQRMKEAGLLGGTPLMESM